MSFLHLAVLAPFALAAVVPWLHRVFPRVHTGWFVLPLPVMLFVFWLSRLPVIRGGAADEAAVGWIPSLGIEWTIVLDGLGILFALLISGIGALVTLYSIFYLSKSKEKIGHFYLYLLLFMGAMLGVVLSDNLIVLYAFWELTSFSSFLLIAFWHHRQRSRYGALKSILLTVFGGFAMLAGFLLLYLMTGTFGVRDIVQIAAGEGGLAGHPLFVPAMVLVLLGAFTKSAQFPFHIWLPDAMEAPTPVSAYLHSATMVKAGLYLVARLTPVFGGSEPWFWLVSAFGLATLFWGSFQAVKQTDLKALLAFSTVSQLGLIMCLFGLGSASLAFGGQSGYVIATTAALFHLINHATFKGALFMVAGIVDHGTGTRDIRKLGGLAAVMPITFTLSVVGAASMAGLPPFNGFLSKEMFFTGVLAASSMNFFSMEFWGAAFPVVAWVASVFTFLYSALFVFRTFLGRYQSEELPSKPHEASFGLLAPPAALASLVVGFGLFPDLASHWLIEPALASVLPALLAPGDGFHVHIAFWHGWTTELFMTIGVVLFGALLFATFRRWKGVYRAFPERLSLNALYDGALRGLERGAAWLTNAYMTGSVRHYLIYIFLFLVIVAGLAMAQSGSFGAIRFPAEGGAPVGFYEALLVTAALLATLAVPFAKSRLSMIVLVGAVGYMVVLFFVLFRAPDLALTQMIVETVSVALFLLCFYHLPKLKKEEAPRRVKATNAVVSVLVGATVAVVALAAGGGEGFPSIAEYFVAESYHLGGGKNIVNVILVDFRGFDTLLEITVLGIASLGIYAMIRHRAGRKKGESPNES